MLPIVIIFQRGFNDDIECLYIKRDHMQLLYFGLYKLDS